MQAAPKQSCPLCRTMMLLPPVPSADYAPDEELPAFASSEALRRAKHQLRMSHRNGLGVVQALRAIFPRLSAEWWADWLEILIEASEDQVGALHRPTRDSSQRIKTSMTAAATIKAAMTFCS